MTTYQQLLLPRYIEFSHLSASDLDEKQLRDLFVRHPWCCYIGLPGQKVVTREQFFEKEVSMIKEKKRQMNRIKMHTTMEENLARIPRTV